MTSNNKDKDHITGVETTGHEWDGLKELNNPAPRWWLWIFFITVIWSIGYWVIYPAWPTLSGEGVRGGTPGNKNWTQYSQLKEDQAEIIARKEGYLKAFHQHSLKDVVRDPELYAFAIAGGKAAFKDNCATCHGTGGAGGAGYPNLNDDDWLWGGSLDAIYETIKYGIRSHHDDTRISQMPAFGEILEGETVEAIADYVWSFGNKTASVTHPGALAYQENCAMCHGENGQGDREFGAPNLADAIWLYSDGSKEAIASQVKNPKHGVMPTWEGRLDEDTIRQLTLYVHSLGGGE